VCWDNAAAESFFGALKNEMYYRQAFPDRAAARSAVADYIEVFYNEEGCTPPWATTPRRSPHRLPDRSSHCMINPRTVQDRLTHRTVAQVELRVGSAAT
jgi:transposase InsO family protein